MGRQGAHAGGRGLRVKFGEWVTVHGGALLRYRRKTTTTSSCHPSYRASDCCPGGTFSRNCGRPFAGHAQDQTGSLFGSPRAPGWQGGCEPVEKFFLKIVTFLALLGGGII